MNRREDLHGYSKFIPLVSRMKQIVNTLSEYQRNYHVTRKVDLFWYIQKLTEVETLDYRLAGNGSDVLRNYLDNLVATIDRRLSTDEKFLLDYIKKINK